MRTWYRSRGYVERPIAVWYAVFDGDTPSITASPGRSPRARPSARSDLDDFAIRLDLPGGLRLYGQGPGRRWLADRLRSRTIRSVQRRPSLRPRSEVPRPTSRSHPAYGPDDVFLPLMEGKWIHQYNPSPIRLCLGSGQLGCHAASVLEESGGDPPVLYAQA